MLFLDNRIFSSSKRPLKRPFINGHLSGKCLPQKCPAKDTFFFPNDYHRIKCYRLMNENKMRWRRLKAFLDFKLRRPTRNSVAREMLPLSLKLIFFFIFSPSIACWYIVTSKWFYLISCWNLIRFRRSCQSN